MKANINTELLGLCKPLSFFKLDPKNARSHPRRSLDAIKASYTQFGQQKPVVCLQDGTLVAGNGQLTVAQELGWDQLAAVLPSTMTAKDAKPIREAMAAPEAPRCC
jgi:ParB-like chromosome segregation protein Spo0J